MLNIKTKIKKVLKNKIGKLITKFYHKKIIIDPRLWYISVICIWMILIWVNMIFIYSVHYTEQNLSYNSALDESNIGQPRSWWWKLVHTYKLKNN